MGARRREPALVLLIGAGKGSALFLRELAQGSDAPYRVVGIIDDQGEHTGQRIQGVDVLGDWDQVETVQRSLGGTRHPATAPGHDRAEPNLDKLRQLVDLAQARGIELSRMPRLPALQKAEDGAAPTLRPVEIGDLLGRPEKVLDRAAVTTLISGKRVRRCQRLYRRRIGSSNCPSWPGPFVTI